METLTNKVIIDIKGFGDKTKKYNFKNIIWSQNVLKPNELRFSMQKKDWSDYTGEGSFSIAREVMGAEVVCEILTKYFDDKDELKEEDKSIVFKGIIFDVNVSCSTDSHSEQFIEVQAFSHDYLMKDNPNCFSYEEMTLKEIITKTLEPYNLSKEIDPRSTESILYTVQYNESSYQFLTRLAQRYGEWMYHDGKKWIFGKIKKKNEGKPLVLGARNEYLKYNYHAGLIHHKIKHSHHNYLEYKNPIKTYSDFPELSNSSHILTGDAIKMSEKNFTKETFQHLRCSNPEGNDESDELSISVKTQLFGEKTQQVVCTGSSVRSDLTIGSCIQIADNFYINNKSSIILHDPLMITDIVHYTEENGEYRNSFTAVPVNCEYPPYLISDLYPQSSAQRAKVIDNKDPEKMGRIRVQFLWQEEQDSNLMTPWIRIAQPHGGDAKGFYFIPEINEEVMVDFENGNAEKPYVVGTLYHCNQKPKDNHVFDDNILKSIRTRNGHTISFVDEGVGGRMGIFDSEKDTGTFRSYFIGLDSDKKLIKLISRGNIELYASNNIIMNAGGNIESTAGYDIIDKAGHDINMKADNDIIMKADNDKKVDVANNLTVTVGSAKSVSAGSITEAAGGEMKLTSGTHSQEAKGTMDLKAGGTLTAEGAVVQIN